MLYKNCVFFAHRSKKETQFEHLCSTLNNKHNVMINLHMYSALQLCGQFTISIFYIFTSLGLHGCRNGCWSSSRSLVALTAATYFIKKIKKSFQKYTKEFRKSSSLRLKLVAAVMFVKC